MSDPIRLPQIHVTAPPPQPPAIPPSPGDYGSQTRQPQQPGGDSRPGSAGHSPARTVVVQVNGQRFELTAGAAAELKSWLEETQRTTGAMNAVGLLLAAAHLFGLVTETAEAGAWLVTGGAGDSELILKVPTTIERAAAAVISRDLADMARRAYSENRTQDGRVLERLRDVMRFPDHYRDKAIRKLSTGDVVVADISGVPEQLAAPMLVPSDDDIALMQEILEHAASTDSRAAAIRAEMLFPLEVHQESGFVVVGGRDYGLLSALLYGLAFSMKRDVLQRIESRNSRSTGSRRLLYFSILWGQIEQMTLVHDQSWRKFTTDDGSSVDAILRAIELRGTGGAR